MAAADLELGSVNHQLYRPYCGRGHAARHVTSVTIVGTKRNETKRNETRRECFRIAVRIDRDSLEIIAAPPSRFN